MRKRQGPRLEVGGVDSLPGFKVRLEAPSAPEKASGHLAGGTLSHLLKGPRCRQTEGDRPTAAFHQRAAPDLEGTGRQT